MKTTVKKSLEIPARKHQKETIEKEAPAEKSFLLVINLWIFRFEYRREQLPTDA
ncbi:hypothetical protein Murru_2474 [Allomuricauda ruestringensis DSM 13258]|uniref:Uncharacterized protein n=1 Tax=Allomuricauda ruestringensis (strain DSM 13258 / CIP 107369 / LMG 19739 / B1) TaxID=886377 RepID=G2PPT4_ALLRU|nr:hypothetical protein [Allomuricauda ruestringensis]AEM71512.1 hypothetical protein Murru_2474 [Allomuricauda ruestringensis DSM 13258]|tara:strand:- start:319 stop:480 length:162 start_codon:yes stop_codon:yes gene_type:complete